MAFAKVYSAQTTLLDAEIIDVEVDLSNGLHAFSIVGLPDKGVEESKDRVSAAIKNSGYKSPKNKNQKVVVSLAPADVKKEGPLFDLAIALAYLLAAQDIAFDAKKKIFLGELSLDGKLREIKGVLALAEEAKRCGFTEIFVPRDNAREAALIEGITVWGIETLKEIIDHLNTKQGDIPADGESRVKKLVPVPQTIPSYEDRDAFVDFSDIKGQEAAKRGLEIAAAGRHNIALWGPPGTGKTMLSEALSYILPPLSLDDALETTAIHSIAGVLETDLITHPPFRAPHHSASHVALIGGGSIPKPGEVTLAHHGVLFLDEFPEFERRVIEALREPLENRKVSISRARGSATFPANFIFIAALNPCPCGNFGVAGKECTCSPIELSRYQRKISGPIIDRIDMWVEVSKIDHDKLGEGSATESESKKIKARVERAREIQRKRFEKSGQKIKTNSELKAKNLLSSADMNQKSKDTLTAAGKKLDLSARSFHRVIKLARTIADLEESEKIEEKHILEALQYRPKKQTV